MELDDALQSMGITPFVSPDDLADIIAGRLPDGGGGGAPNSAPTRGAGINPGAGNPPAGYTLPGMPASAPPAVRPATDNSIPPPADLMTRGTMVPPGSTTPPNLYPAGAKPAAPVLPPGTALPQPPSHDMLLHQQLMDNIRKANAPAANVKFGPRDYLAAALLAFSSGFGRDQGAAARGVNAGMGYLDKKTQGAESERQQGIQTAKEAMDQHEFDEGQKDKKYQQELAGFNAQTSRGQEENRVAGEKRQQQALDNEIDPKAKSVKVTDDQGKERWMVRTKGGGMVETSAPDKKTFHSAYERSQSSDPAEAGQGRKDYDAEQKRQQQRADADSTRAAADTARANRAGGGKGGAKHDPAVRHYNDKVDKERTRLQSAVTTAQAVPGWQNNPVLKSQVQGAIDNYNQNVNGYYHEYQDEAGDNPKLDAPAKEPYPWEKGKAAPSGGTPNNAPTAKTQPASGGGSPAAGKPPETGHAVQVYTSSKGVKYETGKQVTSGPHKGKWVKQAYDNGTVDLLAEMPKRIGAGKP